ncbi:hypothetical protein GCM10010988_30510 [Cnuibacter physcomitrellae]|uniref:Uncharacterized protein n=1 Tax=Cnuibacter physcomitrellae TaxID=1619308 RepID=A0A1X9LGN0_9MICO|nr:hypothetical protein [Cnuibacter physcomitrellae]ARJ04303.1 hypothetical protein B5808_02950 [Cnuibacter physcomitrellae]GGI40722.1 hypothetical protein GCM10010988_30510 [Cnuibacter physcomitrellae]
MIGVHTSLPRFAAAGQELRGIVEPADGVQGAIVAVSGEDGWSDRVLRAIGAGAAGVVVSRPRRSDPRRGAELIEASRSTPIVLDRAWLREDDVRRTLPVPELQVVVASCAGPARVLPELLRDCLGWTRRWGGVLGAAVDARSAEGVLAIVDLSGGRSSTVQARVLAEASAVPRMRVGTLGPQRLEVELLGEESVVRRDTEQGRTEPPRPLESRERSALRRVIAALGDEALPDEVSQLLADDRRARELLGRPT